MKHFAIITNTKKDTDFKFTNAISRYILDHGFSCVCCEEKATFDQSVIPDETECVITLGGDGTMIRVATQLQNLELPLIGVNIGHLGFLCALDPQNVYEGLEKIFLNQLTIERRMMLSGYSVKDLRSSQNDIALNDIVIHSAGSLHVISFRVYVNGEYLNTYKADGIIFSTATGSTAYNLSAGGPIVDPKAELILMTPINSHMLISRSIIFSPSDHVEVEIESRGKENDDAVEVSFDGRSNARLQPGDRIIIEKSIKDTKIIKLNNLSFLQNLSKKMNSYQ